MDSMEFKIILGTVLILGGGLGALYVGLFVMDDVSSYFGSAVEEGGEQERVESQTATTSRLDGSGLDTSFKNAYVSDAGLQCDTRLSSGTVTKYISDGRMLSVGKPPEELGRDLITYTLTVAHPDSPDDIYVWQEGEEADVTGRQYTSEFKTTGVPDSKTAPTLKEDLLEFQTSEDVNCKTADVSDISFAVPEDITFEMRDGQEQSEASQEGGNGNEPATQSQEQDTSVSVSQEADVTENSSPELQTGSSWQTVTGKSDMFMVRIPSDWRIDWAYGGVDLWSPESWKRYDDYKSSQDGPGDKGGIGIDNPDLSISAEKLPSVQVVEGRKNWIEEVKRQTQDGKYYLGWRYAGEITINGESFHRMAREFECHYQLLEGLYDFRIQTHPSFCEESDLPGTELKQEIQKAINSFQIATNTGA